MQVAVIEYARHVAELGGAHSTEFEPATPHPVIALISEWQDRSGAREVRADGCDLGASMRLGAQECRLAAGTLARRLYDVDVVLERHRHRYELNNTYLERLGQAGELIVAGRSIDDALVEVIELGDHPWFLACQFHPEFTSTPRDGHPLFTGFVQAARARRARLPGAQPEPAPQPAVAAHRVEPL